MENLNENDELEDDEQEEEVDRHVLLSEHETVVDKLDFELLNENYLFSKKLFVALKDYHEQHIRQINGVHAIECETCKLIKEGEALCLNQK